MKTKIYTSSLCLLLVVAVISCGKKQADSSGQDVENSSTKANATIIYTNAVVDYLNSADEWVYINNPNMDVLIKSVETRDPNLTIKEITDLQLQNTDVDFDKPISTLSAGDQKFFKDNLSKYSNTLNSLAINAKELERYMKEGEYKTDNFGVAEVLVRNVKSDRDYLSNNRDSLLNKVRDVAEQAELLTLQNHPFREPILAMKADIKLMNNVYDLLDAYSNGVATISQVDAKYQELVSSAAKNRKSYTDSLKDQQSKFDDFYKSLDQVITIYQTNLDTIKSTKNNKIADEKFKEIDSKADVVIENYNLFIG